VVCLGHRGGEERERPSAKDGLSAQEKVERYAGEPKAPMQTSKQLRPPRAAGGKREACVMLAAASEFLANGQTDSNLSLSSDFLATTTLATIFIPIQDLD